MFKLSLATALITAITLLTSGCSMGLKNTHVEQVSATKGQELFELSVEASGPFIGYEDESLHQKSKEVCVKGYNVLTRSASSTPVGKASNVSCSGAGFSDCQYQLTWRIQCTDRAERPFSIFGKY